MYSFCVGLGSRDFWTLLLIVASVTAPGHKAFVPQNLTIFWDCLGSQTLQFPVTIVLQMFVFSSLSCLSSAPAVAAFISHQSGTNLTTVQLGLPALTCCHHCLLPCHRCYLCGCLPLSLISPANTTGLLLTLMVQHQGGSPLTAEPRHVA